MDGQFTPYVHAPICATSPLEGICFAAYDAEIGFVSEAYPSRESQSLYGQATVNIDDANRAIFGFRYTEDEFSSNVTNFFGLQQYLIQDELDETTGRIAYERDLDEDTMVYVSYTKGFKPGGSNLTFGWPVDDEREFGALPAPQLVFPLFQSEMIDAFEVGLKTDFLEGRMRANISAFAYDYENLQFQSTDPDVYRGGVANIPESEMSGVELEFTALISDNLTFDMNLASIDSEVSADYEVLDNVLAFGYFFGEEDLRYALRENVKGNELAKTPDFTADLTMTYETVLASGNSFTTILQYIKRSEFMQRVSNNRVVDVVPG